MLSCKKQLAIILFFILPLPLYAASFDCLNVSNDTEKKICADAELDALDEKLAAAYSEAKEQSSNPAVLKKEQIQWIKNRNLCSKVECIKSAYVKRTAILSGMSNISAASPTERFKPANTGILNNSTEPLEFLGRFEEFRPQYRTVKFQNGKLYFSQYGKSGNNYDVIAIDIDSQSIEYLAREHHQAVFIAENDSYVVIQTQEQMTRPLVVLDKKTGKVLGKLKIEKSIEWSNFSEENFVIVQAGMKKNRITFSLPELNVVEVADTSLPIVSERVASWNKKLVVLGRAGLEIYDKNFVLLNTIYYHPEPASKGNSCSGQPLSVVGDKAIVITNCGHINIYDLISGKWDRTIQPYSGFYSLTPFGKEFLFSASIAKSLSKNKTHVFNVNTGKEVAIIPIDGSYLFATEKYLLTLHFETSKKSFITIYKVNKDSLGSEDYLIKGLLSACSHAAEVADSGDIYKAIDLCESAGMNEVVRDAEMKPELVKYIKLYGIWLSMTYARSAESIPILKRFLADIDSAEIYKKISEAKLKSKFFSDIDNKYESNTELTTEFRSYINSLPPEELHTEFGRIISRSDFNIKETKIDFGAFNDLFYFDGDKVYIAKWSPEVVIQVYNRADFSIVKSVMVEAYPDSESQPIITSITSDDAHVYASISRRWEDESNIDFVIVDKKTLEVIKKLKIGAENLFSYGGKIYFCPCESYSICSSLNLVDFTLSKENELTCEYDKFYRIHALMKLSTKNIDKKIINETVVANGSGDLYAGKSWSEYPIIIVDGKVKGLSSRIAIKKNSETPERVLLDLNHAPNSTPAFLLDGKNLYVGNARDFFIYDTEKFRLVAYIKDFISSEEDRTKCCIDFNKISRFIVDGDRLIVLTQNGIKSKILYLDR